MKNHFSNEIEAVRFDHLMAFSDDNGNVTQVAGRIYLVRGPYLIRTHIGTSNIADCDVFLGEDIILKNANFSEVDRVCGTLLHEINRESLEESVLFHVLNDPETQEAVGTLQGKKVLMWVDSKAIAHVDMAAANGKTFGPVSEKDRGYAGA